MKLVIQLHSALPEVSLVSSASPKIADYYHLYLIDPSAPKHSTSIFCGYLLFLIKHD